MPELIITVTLSDPSSVTKAELVKPTLALLFECDKDSITWQGQTLSLMGLTVITELNIKVPLSNNQAYIAKMESFKPILVLLFGCEEEEVVWGYSEESQPLPQPQREDYEMHVKGKVTFVIDFDMVYNTTDADDDAAQGALDIISDYSRGEICICEKFPDGTYQPASFATFSTISVESVEASSSELKKLS
jgi:hypothetical protein